jgi:hypothetical protein
MGPLDPGGRVQDVNQLGRLADREVLGPGDAVLLQEAGEVGMLAHGDRADGPHLLVGGRPARARTSGRRAVGMAVPVSRAVVAGMPVRRVARRRCRRVVRRRRGRRLQAGQLFVDGLVGGDVGIADPGVEGVQVAIQQAGVDLELEVARGADGAVIGQPDLAADAHVESQGHVGSSKG